MKIILTQDFSKLGRRGDIVVVKDGYARNYLIPQGIAREATPQAIKEVELRKKIEQEKQRKHIEKLRKLGEELSRLSITVSVRTGEEEKLYGAVTNIDIAKALRNEGYEVDKAAILLEEPIKELGVYQIPVRLHPDIIARVKVWVVKE
ncbi:MAG: 50S ribosomal protein L9 [Candidatus Omnitrophota bacterium]|nr:MAG: 50S ribosomal protein L9 [Candidatus Omnitrophota bacterium]HDM08721.1 50S ribosomal protein L9 [Candidatus Omnitrophota bacterium]